MKKFITIIICLFLPLNILAYSEYIIPGGDNIGITVESKGLIIVGFYKINEHLINKNLQIGDIILEIEDIEISNVEEMSKAIDSNIKDDKVRVKINRNGKLIYTKLELIKESNIYKTGLYIKNKVTGIGTLTYIDPESKIFGALGHEINLNETNKRIILKKGNIYESVIRNIDRSANGTVGSKNANINFDNVLGNIYKNSKYGIYGKYSKIMNSKKLKVAEFGDIKLGKAYMYTNINGNNKEKFEIEIINISDNIKSNKVLSFKITDISLLEKTGGIIQGMSGSPIIQENKIIGAVTHVVIDDVTKGYGIFIRTMLEEGEKEEE